MSEIGERWSAIGPHLLEHLPVRHNLGKGRQLRNALAVGWTQLTFTEEMHRGRCVAVQNHAVDSSGGSVWLRRAGIHFQGRTVGVAQGLLDLGQPVQQNRLRRSVVFRTAGQPGAPQPVPAQLPLSYFENIARRHFDLVPQQPMCGTILVNDATVDAKDRAVVIPEDQRSRMPHAKAEDHFKSAHLAGVRWIPCAQPGPEELSPVERPADLSVDQPELPAWLHRHAGCVPHGSRGSLPAVGPDRLRPTYLHQGKTWLQTVVHGKIQPKLA